MKRANLVSLKRAAARGDVEVQIALAAKLALGDGVQKDEGQAARLYGEAMSQGSGEAAFNLATMYARGEGVRANWRKAFSLFKKAERLGSGDASVALGEFALRTGDKTKPDPVAAIYHFAVAALHRDSRGLFLLASTAHEYSIPMAKLVESIFLACAEIGHPGAKKAIRNIRKGILE